MKASSLPPTPLHLNVREEAKGLHFGERSRPIRSHRMSTPMPTETKTNE